ncbi:MAG: hypothetical protein A2946_03775 [Candidatus Liptonbacteria bacterium RIFCSPLOWO2_01_FULL_53_13]|uniref:LTD domain-containing protein n=1 Tax=Candidatus Liptonbacteria bacterium RIFCSPLOWO2_01_FULL_53_13 TaxID=1798651 RepID=A0A1G2CMR1_9BACT|nr:MAG: hypothetical protein A2946_03775 [Candidatus Liptonbacteria bacterium RIFCSPLOWO2_01_FULL_53_13]
MHFLTAKAAIAICAVFAVVGIGGYAVYHGGTADLLAVSSETLKDAFSFGAFSSPEPALRIQLDEPGASNASETGESRPQGTGTVSGAPSRTQVPQQDIPQFVPLPFSLGSAEKSAPANPIPSASSGQASDKTSNPVSASVPALSAGDEGVPRCNFSRTSAISSAVRINELAWMGSTASASDEWIELKNISAGSAPLSGWQIASQDDAFKIVFGSGEKISAGGLYLLERTDDASVPGISADKIYKGALPNGGTWLKLFNANCDAVDEMDARNGFAALGGDAGARKTLERNQNGAGWHTSAAPDGTPRRENSTMTMTMTPASATPQSEMPAPPASVPTSTVITETPPPPVTPPAEPPPQAQPVTPSPAMSAIVINEVMAGMDGDLLGEFIELYNPSSQAVTLTGWSIKKKNSNGKEESFVVTSHFKDKSVAAGEYFLLKNDGTQISTPTADLLWPHSHVLAYTNNAVALYDASGAKVSEISWTEIPKGKSFGKTAGGAFAVLGTPTPRGENRE